MRRHWSPTGAARGCRHILIEERLTGPRLDTTDVYMIASGQAAGAARTLAAIAYVDVNAEGRLMQFAEDVAVNRAVPVKIFDTIDANWSEVEAAP